MEVEVVIKREVTETKTVEMQFEPDDLLTDTLQDAVEAKMANDEFEVLDEDIDVTGDWEVESIA